MSKITPLPKRALSLDALRGFAILMMVLSGTIAFGILPAWMYHAQTPPPLNKFDPTVFGITWVDLVFPFFLFAMGAAFPFSMGKRLEKGVAQWRISIDSILRGCQLAFFAIFIQHLYPWVVSAPADYRAWFTTLGAFALMFPMFMRLPWKMPEWGRYAVKFAAFGAGVLMLLTVKYANDRTFALAYSNIIILVLANMAIFGSLAYIFTAKNKLARLAILPFVMAVFLGKDTDGSWQQAVFNFSPVPWMYKFYYLKYLFIVLPGSIAGEYLLEWMAERELEKQEKLGKQGKLGKQENRTAILLLMIVVALMVCNLVFLFARMTVMNLLVTSGLLLAGYLLLKPCYSEDAALWKKFFTAGAFLLMLGLFFEAFEGGIRKDSSTYSYYFVTSGLAFMTLIFFSIVCDYFRWRKSTSFLVMAGQNPMIAYVGASMVVIPILHITGAGTWLDMMMSNPWTGFLRGVIVTALVTLMTMFFTRIKWFWRT
jgi:predicted acyltransferase